MRHGNGHHTDGRPNIMLIMSDEHDPAVTGCYGHRHVLTPHLDQLASEGAIFDRAYCNSPICVPSRASFLTGQYVHEIGVWDNGSRLKGEIPTFGSYFEAAGYDTVLCGRMHMVGENRLHGFGRRLYDDMDAWIFNDHRPHRTPQARRNSASHVTESGPGTGSWQSYDETVTSLAERFLRSRAQYPSSGPWLLACGFMFPHFPLIAPQELFDLYWPSNIAMPNLEEETFSNQHPAIQQLRYFLHNEEEMPESVIRSALASYYALITFTDMHVGRLVQAVDDSALRDNTIIVYISDHGEMAGAHGLWQKQCFYEPAVRVPLIVRVPGGQRSIRVPDNVSLVDVMPTLLEMASIPLPSNIAGTSLWDNIRGLDTPQRDVFSEYHAQGMIDGGFMLKRGDWKYVHYAGGHEPQLFNVRLDPGEFLDLAQDSSHGDVRAELHQALLEVCDPDRVNELAKSCQRANAGPGAALQQSAR